MSEMRVSDPSALQLKKELTQIRRAARVLRDPGTTSSWKSPLSSARSVAALPSSSSAWKNESKRFNASSQLDLQYPLPCGNHDLSNGKEKRVFLYNWKNHKSSSEKSGRARNDEEGQEEEDEDDGGNEESSSLLGSIEDSLSDARNGCDSKSDSYIKGQSRSSIFRRRDANLVAGSTPSARRTMASRKKGKKNERYLDILSKYRQGEATLGRKFVNIKTVLEGHPSMALTRDDSVEQSDDTEGYCHSEDLRRIPGASPLLLKLRHKNLARSSSKFLRSGRKEDSSNYSTPALSTSSYNVYGHRNPSTVGSWDGTTTSMNDGDDGVEDPLNLPGRHGCGIPCYWSKRTPKHRGMCGSCYSPSFSDTIRRKGSSILCGNQVMYPRHRRSSLSCKKRRAASRSAQGVLPLLTNSGGGGMGSSIGTGRSDDELSTNFGELDLEGLSQLDGRRWSSSCRSQDGLEIIALNREEDEEGTPENIRSFSQKYKPMFFGELIGQNIVTQSLINSISRGRIAPVYLFQGPRGTGKTSTARIFAAALNCQAPEGTKPCGYCRECADYISGKSMDLLEVDGTNKKGIDGVRYVLKQLSVESSSSRFMVFVIDECHLLPSKTWLALLKFIEEPPQRVVFIFITTDIDNVPRTIQSRSQKYLFNKIKDGDIVAKLRKISANENLDIELDALDLIALNADGSLRDAETMLEQLNLLGKRITTSLVNELVGVVSDEKLLELLELAMSSDTAETVKRARDLMDSGVDPIVLMSQLASLIMDIIAGTYNVSDAKYGASFFSGRNLTESELERLKHALKLLSEAEKQLRISSDRSTWFTATLLQLGSVPSPDLTLSSSSRRQSCKTTEDDPSSASREAACKQNSDVLYVPRKSTSPASMRKAANGNLIRQGDLLPNSFSLDSKPSSSPGMSSGESGVPCDEIMAGNIMFRCMDPDKLCVIWANCIQRCHSKTLRQLLDSHGKLLSICEVEGVLVAYVAFRDANIKLRAERFLSSITNSMEVVLRCNVDVRLVHLPDGEASAFSTKPLNSTSLKHGVLNVSKKEQRGCHANEFDGYSKFSPLQDANFQSTNASSDILAEGNAQTGVMGERRQDIPMQRIESIIREQRLETAWLQAAEKGTPGSLSRLRPEKNQVLPQDGIYCKDQMEPVDSARFSSQHWEDELNHELEVLKVNNGKDQTGRRADRYPMSPSLLHNSSAMKSIKDNTGYEPGSGTRGCSRFFCWNNYKPRRGKVMGMPVRGHKSGRFSLFGECGKPKKSDSKFRR